MIDHKIVYIKTKEKFEGLIDTIPENLNPLVFIEDTREMWICGTYFSIGFPGINVSEISGSVKVEIGNSYFLMQTVGEGLGIRKGDGNRIIISSSALTKINTEVPLEWDISAQKLIHQKSGVAAGIYGQSSNISNASVFLIPNIQVNETGHISLIETHTVSIRDYVEQLSPSTLVGNRNVLLSYNESSNNSDTAQVRKANGLLFNDSLKKLTVEGGILSNSSVTVNKGDLQVLEGYIIGKVKGDVEGEATPKIHLSDKPEYGGSSTQLYGHVKLQDVLSVRPPASSTNSNTNNVNVEAYAASPLMVWNAIETAKEYANSLLGANNAMLFKGSIQAGISSPGTFTPEAKCGNTYVVSFGDTTYTNSIGYINGEQVEVGDLLICKEDTTAATSTNYKEINNKWTFVQTNTTGTVSGPTSSIKGQLAIFSSSTGRLIEGLANGTVGQVLAIGASGIPEWNDATKDTWRGFSYKNSEQSAVSILDNSTTSGDLTFGAVGNLKLTWDQASKTLTFTTISDNTWRDVLAYTSSSSSPQSIGDNSDLIFSGDFLWDDSQLYVGWASVDSNGTITYTK